MITYTREEMILRAAIAAAYGEPHTCPQPHEPNETEAVLLRARACFLAGYQCRGWDILDTIEWSESR
jgi:hypothetical protein